MPDTGPLATIAWHYKNTTDPPPPFSKNQKDPNLRIHLSQRDEPPHKNIGRCTHDNNI
jgi:hypothetical protein